ncbi:hypothetical protein SR1949_13430 [Sphaerospermopsis reniformis]|uniref:Uncharacterized protein n=1 Tax=Sphaerospermopsis reniformis TaxID=531300 RepID=A0A479ZYP5_9CYAN|nr:hypothetical protein [Sphaerospermopsis reniformis]GCL36241.1 hypothetical protein SR1949_13430 [Sphaerospermopsis reniformis]
MENRSVRPRGLGSNEEFTKNLFQKLETNPKYQKQYQRDGVFLFVRN